MYIKQVIIHGFKSYRDQTILEPFDKRHNVIVGQNGSGKSNLFYAIQFVLSDEFIHLLPELRGALLYKGPQFETQKGKQSAYVEIIFDNTDNRMPVESNEIHLKRLLGEKNDQYFLNNKMVRRREVLNLLESAGFSKSNPYYIVKQGKINEMAIGSDAYRLKLLREVAGLKVYEEKHVESMNQLEEAAGQLDQIEEFIVTVEDQLRTLQGEKDELQQYLLHDKKRRALEYFIHEMELNQYKNKLETLEIKRTEIGSEQINVALSLKAAQNHIKTYIKKSKDTKKELTTWKYERENLSNDLQHQLIEKTKLDLTIKDLAEKVVDDTKSTKHAKHEFDQLNKSIKDTEDELGKVNPKYEEIKIREDKCKHELALKEQKRTELYAKQGRGSLFTSKVDRDRWIHQELKSLNNQLKDKKDHRDKLETDIKCDAAKAIELTKKIEEHSQEMDRQKHCLQEHNKQCYELKKNKDQLHETQNKLYSKENNVLENLLSLKEDLAIADQQLRSKAGKSVLNGRNSVRKVLDTFLSRGGREAEIAQLYYGTVIENFGCEQSIYTAVEITAGKRLFHHIIESDIVGTQILKEMNRQKLPGEVTFMPLNRLDVRSVEYPNDPDATVMMSMLQFDAKYDKAIRFLFGKTLICSNMEVATKLARPTGLNCVTFDGDQVSSKGFLTGGYHNPQRSSLEAQKTRSDVISQISKCEAELKSIYTELTKSDMSINSNETKMQETETKISEAKGIIDKVKGELRLMREELSSIECFKTTKERSLAQCKSNLEAMQTTKDGLESELHQELLSQLSAEDQAEVYSLNDTIERLQKENKETFSSRMKLEAEKNQLENLLTNNLTRRRDEVMCALEEISVEDRKGQLNNYKNDVKEIDSKIKATTHEFNVLEEEIKAATRRLEAEQNDLDNWTIKERDAQEKIYADANRLDKLVGEQNRLEQKIADCVEKINQLGSLPSDEINLIYAQMESRRLFKELQKTNNELKKFSHVNKKAVDQYISLSNEREKLQKRKEEFELGFEKIKQLIRKLHQHKLKAIHFTFKQVSKYFTEVFKKLVPVGCARLFLRSKDNEDVSIEDMDSDTFNGIGIKVSFLKSNFEMKEMNHLSGGQKTLVALALIFAIQKCDPAPFYLFDEIDQALDAQYRTRVADMIHELSKKAQFITTTFRPELLQHAHKFYGVTFRNKVSYVDCVSREEARDFVEKDKANG